MAITSVWQSEIAEIMQSHAFRNIGRVCRRKYGLQHQKCRFLPLLWLLGNDADQKCFTFTSDRYHTFCIGCFMAILGRYEPCKYSIKSIAIYFYHCTRCSPWRPQTANWYPRNLLSLSMHFSGVLLNQTGSRWNPLLNAAKVDWRLNLFFFWKPWGWFCLSRFSPIAVQDTWRLFAASRSPGVSNRSLSSHKLWQIEILFERENWPRDFGCKYFTLLNGFYYVNILINFVMS